MRNQKDGSGNACFVASSLINISSGVDMEQNRLRVAKTRILDCHLLDVENSFFFSCKLPGFLLTLFIVEL